MMASSGVLDDYLRIKHNDIFIFSLGTGHWRDGGSGWMKEDALDLAKGRVYKLELQLKEEMKKSLKESQAKQFYMARGGQWKSSFMELSDRVGRKACKV